MNANPLILALDLGSTFFKAALFAPDGRRVAEESVPVPYSRRDGVHVELDPEEIWQSAAALIRKTCRAVGVGPESAGCISIASQAQTFTLTDASGKARMPFLSWLDKRAQAESAELTAALGADFHRHTSVPSPLPDLQIARLLWVRRHQPKVWGDATCVMPLPSFIAQRLAGVWITDRNLAAMSGLYSIPRNDWWTEALSAVGLSTGQLPKLVNTGEMIPACAPSPELKLSPDVKLVLAGNDQTAGAYGNGAHAGAWVVTLGTALVAYRHAGARPGPFGARSFWGPYPGGGHYELAVRSEGCAALDWARAQLMPSSTVEEFHRLAAAAAADPFAHRSDPNARPRFYPAAMGSPLAWAAKGEPGATALAVLEGIGYSLRQLIFEDLRADVPPARLRAIGGGSRNPAWLQILADILACPVARGCADGLDGAWAMASRRQKDEAGSESPLMPDPVRVEFHRRMYRRWTDGAPPPKT